MSRHGKLLPAKSLGARRTSDGFFDPLRWQTELLALGMYFRDKYAGGGVIEIAALMTGDVDLQPAIPIEFDNVSNQITSFDNSNGGTLVVQYRFFLAVSDPSISVTPKLYDLTAAADATISGALSCSATADDYSGTHQQQTIALTLPSAKHKFKPRLTIAGTVGSPAIFTVRGFALADCYIAS